MYFPTSLRAKRGNPQKFRLPRRTIVLLAMTIISSFYSFPSMSQDSGYLANILAQNCEEYLVKEQTSYGSEYEFFCPGYFEALLELEQNSGQKNIYECFPIQGKYDLFKIRIIEEFILKNKLKESQGDKYLRAFNLARDAINEQFQLECER